MLVDTHLHLADKQFEADRQAVIERAQQAGVTTLIEVYRNFKGHILRGFYYGFGTFAHA